MSHSSGSGSGGSAQTAPGRSCSPGPALVGSRSLPRPRAPCPLQALKARWHLPYGAVVHPMAEDGGPVPVANAAGGPIIRCKRCRTYMNPFMAWMDGGR